MRGKGARPDHRVAEVASAQHGVVSIRQLRAAGLSDDAVRGRLRAGRLHRLHRGVYAVGHVGISFEGRWMAAALACGGAISHRSAASLWDLLPAAGGIVDVTVRGDGGRAKRAGIRLHRSSTIRPDDVTRRRGIPVTTPGRVISDLKRCVATPSRPGVLSAGELRRAIREAEVKGVPVDAGPDRTRSELEHRFLYLCRRYRLPQPEVNVRIGDFLVDFLWRESRLIVETDGYRYHRGRVAFEADRNRDLRLRALGFETIRLSYRQVFDDPRRVAEVLSRELATYRP